MDVTGIVLGAVPLIVGAIRSYGTVTEFIKTLCRWDREIVRVRNRLSVQQTLFLNECSLLLYAVLQDRQQVDDILQARVQSPLSVQLEVCFQKRLGSSYDTCLFLIQDIKEQLEEIHSDLSRLSSSCSTKDYKIRAREVTSNMKSAIKTGFEKNGYSKKIENLKKSREDLASLASQITVIQNETYRNVVYRATETDDFVARFLRIRKASRALHEAFTEAWCRSCREAAHPEHTTLLCLGAQVDECVCLDLAVSNARPDNKSIDRFSTLEPPVWLYVRSITGRYDANSLLGKRRLQASPAFISDVEEPDHGQSTSHWHDAALNRTSGPNWFCRKQPKRKFHHQQRARPTHCRRSPELEEFKPQAVPDTAHNLSAVDNICQHFKQHACNSSSGERCFGYLQTSPGLRHFVYAASKERKPGPGSVQGLPVTLAQVMQTAIDDAMSVPEQLKIAHKLALAVLQFHSTPWIKSQWELEDIGLFRSSGAFDESALKTLHLSARFRKDASTKDHESDVAIDGNNASSSKDVGRAGVVSKRSCSCSGSEQCYCNPESLGYRALDHGVDNMTLCSLGVALVQIGYRKPLDILRADRKTPHNLFTARQLAKHGAFPLGPQYQNIVRKCLRCDFDSGTDLESAELQAAVFNDVIRELESMIDRLSL